MTLIQALLVAVASETACIVFLFGILMAKNKVQDAELKDCKDERKALQAKIEILQIKIADVWECLAKQGLPHKQE